MIIINMNFFFLGVAVIKVTVVAKVAAVTSRWFLQGTHWKRS